MANVTKPTQVAGQSVMSLATIGLPDSCKLSGCLVGEDIAQGDLCYVKSDGLIWRADGTAANAAARVRGIAAMPAKVAQKAPLTLLHGCEVQYVTGLNPGADLFLAVTANIGGFSDVATTGGVNPVGYVIDANRIYIFPIR